MGEGVMASSSESGKCLSLDSLWKYTKHVENKNNMHMQNPQDSQNSTPAFDRQLFDQRFQGAPCFPGGPTPHLTITMGCVWDMDFDFNFYVNFNI